jgi:hypothetical protein
MTVTMTVTMMMMVMMVNFEQTILVTPFGYNSFARNHIGLFLSAPPSPIILSAELNSAACGGRTHPRFSTNRGARGGVLDRLEHAAVRRCRLSLMGVLPSAACRLLGAAAFEYVHHGFRGMCSDQCGGRCSMTRCSSCSLLTYILSIYPSNTKVQFQTRVQLQQIGNSIYKFWLSSLQLSECSMPRQRLSDLTFEKTSTHDANQNSPCRSILARSRGGPRASAALVAMRRAGLGWVDDVRPRLVLHRAEFYLLSVPGLRVLVERRVLDGVCDVDKGPEAAEAKLHLSSLRTWTT